MVGPLAGSEPAPKASNNIRANSLAVIRGVGKNLWNLHFFRGPSVHRLGHQIKPDVIVADIIQLSRTQLLQGG